MFRRRLFTVASAGSLALAAAACALWARSHVVHDLLYDLRWRPAGDARTIRNVGSGSGGLFWHREVTTFPPDPATAAEPVRGWARSAPGPYPGGRAAGSTWRRSVGGFAAYGGRTVFPPPGAAGDAAAWSVVGGVVPHWALLPPAFVLPLLWWRDRARRLRRARAGRCSTCGYDLRASPGRCPECGRSRSTVPSPS